MSSALANYEDGLEPMKIGFDTKIGQDTKPGVTKGASTAERDFVMGIDEAQQEKMRKRGCEGGKKENIPQTPSIKSARRVPCHNVTFNLNSDPPLHLKRRTIQLRSSMKYSRMSQQNHPNNPPHPATNLFSLSLNPTAQPFQSTTSNASMTSSAKNKQARKAAHKESAETASEISWEDPWRDKPVSKGSAPSSVPSISASLTNKHNQTFMAKQKQLNHQERPPTNTNQSRSEPNQSKSGQLIMNRHGEPLGQKAREAPQKQIAEFQVRRNQEAKAEAARQYTITLDQARRDEELTNVEVERSQPMRVPENASTNVEALRDFIIITQRDITRRYVAMSHPAWETAKEDERTLVEMWKK